MEQRLDQHPWQFFSRLALLLLPPRCDDCGRVRVRVYAHVHAHVHACVHACVHENVPRPLPYHHNISYHHHRDHGAYVRDQKCISFLKYFCRQNE